MCKRTMAHRRWLQPVPIDVDRSRRLVECSACCIQELVTGAGIEPAAGALKDSMAAVSRGAAACRDVLAMVPHERMI
jgi:hypothetical protein